MARSGATWKPGQSGNPKGRPKGRRYKLADEYIRALRDEFTKNGAAAIERLQREDAATYLKLVGALVPKEQLLESKGPLTVNIIKFSEDDNDSD